MTNTPTTRMFLRGSLAVSIAALTAVSSGVAAHVAIPVMLLGALLQGLIALRAFIDVSVAQARDDVPKS